MTLGRKILLGAVVATFIIAKFYFLTHTNRALAFATIPAFLLILSSPTEAGATEPKI